MHRITIVVHFRGEKFMSNTLEVSKETVDKLDALAQILISEPQKVIGLNFSAQYGEQYFSPDVLRQSVLEIRKYK